MNEPTIERTLRQPEVTTDPFRVLTVNGTGDVSPTEPVVLALCGELDLATADQLRQTTDTLLAAGRTQIVLDLAALTFLDTTGLDVICRVCHWTTERDGFTRLARVPVKIIRVLRLSRLDRFLPAYPSIQDAIAGGGRSQSDQAAST